MSNNPQNGPVPSHIEPSGLADLKVPKKDQAVPLTISLTPAVVRRARVVAASKEMSLSRLVSTLLEDVIKHELPGMLASFAKEGGAQ